ncbi:hypothetical protein CAEBREN_10289 [Caenorhabditis brenneri]|uniref:Sdz-33 F-box domain-containing protein n=1 Tax=Caenorhabditis brenneri TaxID=135651 RepID=G0P6B8_CAEBE|nr:hypothetical protein CAEBREN_10289 [Caenorhabditis brenneri]
MVMEFLNETFKCSVERVDIYDDNLPESGDIGVKSTVRLLIRNSDLHTFDHAWNQKLSLLLENLEVTGTCTFLMWNTKNGFYVDPTLFKCKRLLFCSGSADWVTKEILLQFEVPQLSFYYCPFPVEDIISFVIHWFHSDNEKLEYLFILIEDNQISLENFQTEELNPVPISDKNRVPSSESFRNIDFSKGLKIVRHDGLQATIHVTGRDFLFYVWHNQ